MVGFFCDLSEWSYLLVPDAPIPQDELNPFFSRYLCLLRFESFIKFNCIGVFDDNKAQNSIFHCVLWQILHTGYRSRYLHTLFHSRGWGERGATFSRILSSLNVDVDFLNLGERAYETSWTSWVAMSLLVAGASHLRRRLPRTSVY